MMLAFDEVLKAVERALESGMQSATGRDARVELESLRSELQSERASAVERGSVDREWLRAIVQDVAAWTPQTELALLAALGRLAREGGSKEA